MIGAIYARVSTDEQARIGYSLQDQINQCRVKLLQLGCNNIKEYIDDGYSGEFLDRPALDELRSDIRQKLIEKIMIYDPDRLSRNLTNQLLIADEIEKADINLYFVTGDYDASPEGRLFFSIRGAISSFEKAKIRERTMRGKREKARQGKIPINNKPYGFDWDAENSIYIINEDEAQVIRKIYDFCIKERFGSPQISDRLTDNKIFNRGRPFNHVAVYRILTKELYCGTAYSRQISTTKTGQRSYKVTKLPREEWIPIAVPAIVSRETWQQAQDAIKQNYRQSKRNSKRDYLLRGLVKCGVCGKGMVASLMKNDGKSKYYYRCVTRSSPTYRNQGLKCTNRFIHVDYVEEIIWQTICNISKGDCLLNSYLRTEALPDRSAEIEKLSIKYEQTKKKQAEIVKWFRNNLIDASVAEKDLTDINKEISAISEHISTLKTSQNNIKKQPAILPANVLAATTTEEKRRIILDYGIQVHLKREGKDFDFWFSH